MASVPDIPDVVHGEAPEPRKLGAYQSFINSQRSLLAYNAAAYINKRVARSNKFSTSKLKKVFKIATFVPAHETRYIPGDFQVEKMKYFVVHRPGSFPAACTLLNTIREFSSENRRASAHFIVGLNGEIIQMVDLQDVALHVGGSTMPDGKKNGNHTSVGVEIEGAVGERFTFAQYTAVAKIVNILNDISGFLPNKKAENFIQESKKYLLGHSEIHPNVKKDPGPNFNYSLLAYLVQKMPSTVSSEWYRPPTDALTSLDSALQQIFLQAANPESATQAAVLNATSSNALAAARQLYMQFGNRGDTANWAADTAKQEALRMQQNLQAQIQQLTRLAMEIPDMPKTSIAPLLNYDTGTYSDEE